MSLGVVAVTATLAAFDHWRRGNVDVRVAAVFGLFGVAGTFAGYMGGVPIDWATMGAFTAVTVTGSFVGARFSGRISQDALKKAFAWFLVVVATYILFESVLGA